MQTKKFSIKMDDGCEIFCNRWMPDDENNIKAVIQLHHGLAEHSMRYDRLGSVLAENGYVLNSYDMRGHGKTGEKTGTFGKLAEKDGFNRVVEDLHCIISSLKKEFPKEKVVLLGHSFGSFVSQGFIEKYGNELDGCVLCGTAGPRNALIKSGMMLAKIIKVFRGGDSIVPFLDKIVFGSYNDRVENPVSKNAWLSANEENIRLYEMDSWCGFKLTTSFFVDMLSGLNQIHKAKNIAAIPKNLPIYFIYGKDDPVGSYGETINKLYNIYKNNGVSNLTIKGYEGDRHEIFNEKDRETVEKDLISWISQI